MRTSHPLLVTVDDVGPGKGEQPQAGKPGWIDMDGDCVFVPRNDYHGFRNRSATETAVMVWYYAGAASLEEAGYVAEAADRAERS